jgi:hypothetical protein
MHSQTVSLNGIELHYQIEGEGEPPGLVQQRSRPRVPGSRRELRTNIPGISERPAVARLFVNVCQQRSVPVSNGILLCKRCYRSRFWSMLRPRVIVGVGFFGRLSRFAWEPEKTRKLNSYLLRTVLGLRRSCSVRRVRTYSTAKADRPLSAKDAANDFRHVLTGVTFRTWPAGRILQRFPETLKQGSAFLYLAFYRFHLARVPERV